MQNLYNTLNEYWLNFVGPLDNEIYVILLDVLTGLTVILLGYFIIRCLAQIFMRGKRRWTFIDVAFLVVILCYIVKSFFPTIFEPTRYIEKLVASEAAETEVVDVEE